MPRYSPRGFDIGAVLWQGWDARCREQGGLPQGLFIDPRSRAPFEYGDVMKGCRLFLQHKVGMKDFKLWTTYSVRRALPTAMNSLKFEARQIDAAGNWQGSERVMNIRYSAAQVASASQARLEALEALERICKDSPRPVSWEVLPSLRFGLDWKDIERKATAVIAADVAVYATDESLLGALAHRRLAFDVEAVCGPPRVGHAVMPVGEDAVVGRGEAKQAKPTKPRKTRVRAREAERCSIPDAPPLSLAGNARSCDSCDAFMLGKDQAGESQDGMGG